VLRASVLAVPSAAAASTVSVRDGTLSIAAAAGENVVAELANDHGEDFTVRIHRSR